LIDSIQINGQYPTEALPLLEEQARLGPRESPILLTKAMQILTETGIGLDTLANDTGLAPETVQEVLQAADSARPRMEITLT
jgi:hypothetical protein